MNIFHAQFSTGQVVEATGVSNNTLQTWLKRNLIVGQKDAPITGGGTPGAHRRFSFFNVMEIAVIKALVDLGLNVSDAGHAAMHFAHSAPGSIGDDRVRLPSLPFNTLRNPCFTIMVVSGDRSHVLPWQPGKAGEDAMVLARHYLGNPVGWVTVEINRIFEAVVTALGFDYRDVLAQAYPVANV